jgi:hypothetical protein
MLITPQSNPRFTQENLDFLVENHQIKTPKEIAAILKKDQQTIYLHLNKYGLKPCVHRPIKSRVVVYKKELIVAVIEDYVTTMDSLHVIALRHNVDKLKVSNWLRDYYFGVPKDENSMVIKKESAI